MSITDYISSIVAGATCALFHPLDSLYYNNIINGKRPELLRRGLTFNTVTSIIKVCGIFPTQEFIKRKLDWMSPYYQNSVSGMATGLIMSIIVTPINAVKVPLITQTTKTNVVTITKEIYAKDGLRGYFKGTGLTLGRDGFGYGTYFALFPILDKQIDNKMIASVTASIIALCVAFPFDVARTYRQNNTTNDTIFQCLKKSINTRGQGHVFAIYMIRMILSIPIGHCTYLWTKEFIEKNNKQSQD
jgi:solute carrier family 25 (mitochondrial carnitine/acylcarnitine transporter), member 20/29